MQKHPSQSEAQWTILKLLQWTTSYFTSHHVESPRASAEILLAHALNIGRIDLYLRYDQPLDVSELKLFKALIRRRLNREPVAYITGETEFWSKSLCVTKDVLIPRPETECLVEAVQRFLTVDHDPSTRWILELGTGSGAITLALVSLFPQHLFFASDCKLQIVKLARQNAIRHENDKQIKFFVGDWFGPVQQSTGRFDVIVSNPPYVRSDVIGGLQPEIARFEPRRALDGGADGLDCIDQIIRQAFRFLKKGGRLYLEIGHDQRMEVSKRISDNGNYREIRFSRDYGGHDRVVQMEKR